MACSVDVVPLAFFRWGKKGNWFFYSTTITAAAFFGHLHTVKFTVF